MDVTLPSGTPAISVEVPDATRGLVIVPDIWGLRRLYVDMCEDLASRTGRSTVAIEPFPGTELPGAEHPDGMTARSAALRGIQDERLLADAAAAAELTGCDRVGLIGFCMGGMYALKAAGHGRFERVVSFYGMIRVPEDWRGPGQGQPLDAVRYGGRRRHDVSTTTPISGEGGEETRQCEVMAIIGTDDGWTPPDDVDELESIGATVVRYEGADHGFVHDPSRPAHRPDDAADAWARALAFLDG